MRINIDNWEEYKCKPDEPIGTKEKKWLMKNGKLWMFKERAMRKESGLPMLNDVSECIASDIISLIGIECSKYTLCERNGVKGVIKPDFLDNDPYSPIKKEEFISGVDLIYQVDSGFRNKWLENPKTKQLYTLSLVLESLNRKGLLKEGLEMVITSLLIANTDCNPSNFGVIKNNETQEIRLAPLFDNEASFIMLISNNRLNREVVEVDGKPVILNINRFHEVIHRHVISKIVLERHFQLPERSEWYQKIKEESLPNRAYNFRIMEYQPMIEYMTTFYPNEISDIMQSIECNITEENIDAILNKYDEELDCVRKKIAREIVLERAKWMTAFYNREKSCSEGRLIL